jgi:MYXO-CTERM domain-containing protein
MRSLFPLALLIVPSAFAGTAFSNFGTAPNFYLANQGRVVGFGNAANPVFVQGTLFTASASGVVSSLSLAMNNFNTQAGVHADYTVELWSNSASDELGSLLGSYAAKSTGSLNNTTTSDLSVVPAGGTSVSLVSGTGYWIVARTADTNSLVWQNTAATDAMRRVTFVDGVANYATSDQNSAFSVEVQAVPEAGSLALVGLGAVGLLRRRR